MYLRTLATLELKAAATSPAVLSLGKPTAVLAFLAASPRRIAPRHSLSRMLWADLGPDAAKHALRQTIWYLKKKAGLDLIVADGDTLTLADVVTVDRDDLLDASRSADHQRVVELYSGPFIPNFAAPGGAGFEEWAALERRRLLEVFRHSAEAVIRSALTNGHARSTIPLARRLRDQDLLNESSWRLLLEVCVSAGEDVAARAEAEALVQLADREELDLEPATRTVVRQIRSHGAGSAAGVAEPAEHDGTVATLVGRELEFSALLRAWDTARTGRLTRVHVTARAGIGKSRLLRDFGARLRAMRAKVVSVSGAQGTRDIEYAVGSELSAGLAALPGKHAVSAAAAATLVDLNPSLSTFFDKAGKPAHDDDRLRLRALALRELLKAVSFEHPVAILIDDLHWWDESSTALVLASLEGVADTRMLVVTAGRPEATGPLTVVAPSCQIELQPLNADQVEELVLSLATLPAESWATTFAVDVWRASRGSPLLTLELLQHLEQQRLIERRAGSWTTPTPDRLREELSQVDVLPSRLRELTRGDLWLLTLFATAGGPLSPDTVSAAAERPLTDVQERITALEARGLLVREGPLTRCAHDEISEAVERVAGDEAVVRASQRVGAILGASHPLDDTTLRRAARLLRAGDGSPALFDVFRRYAAHRYAGGDRRPVAALARDLLGPSASTRTASQLVTSAPWSWRLGLTSPLRRGAVAAAVLIVVLLASLLVVQEPHAAPPDAVLALVVPDSSGRVAYHRVELRRDSWAPRDSLRPTPGSGPPMLLARDGTFKVDYSVSTGQFVTAQSVSDSGIIDLFLYDQGGTARRFVSAIRDDEAPSFSPTGSTVAFVTARWDSLSRYDIAVADVGTSEVRQLTQGPASDGRPRWSPDGGRIAFGRSNWGLRPNEVCVVTLSRDEACRAMAERVEVSVVGWLDRDRLVVFVDGAPVRQLRVVEWSTGEASTWYEGLMIEPSLSPDGNWIFCYCALTPGGDAQPAVFPISAPHLMRPIAITPESREAFRGVFWVGADGRDVPTLVQIDSIPVLYPGVPARLTASVQDRGGAELAERTVIRWSLLDGAASLDSIAGTIVPDGRTPTVTVVARALGSARDTMTLSVSSDSPRLVLDETWLDLHAWVPYGLPSPTVGKAPGIERAFLNNGEGSFESGAVSHARVEGNRGAFVEADIATPVSLPQWQYIRVTLSAHTPSHYSGSAARNATPFYLPANEACDFGFPMEGRISGLESKVTLSSAREHFARLWVPGLKTARPWKLRLQLFPDGRCGLAIDGQPLGIVNGRRHDHGRLHVRLSGNSYGTTIAVGRLRLFEGVGRDLDWTRAPILR